MSKRTKISLTISSAANALGIIPTAIERRAGRLLRAPDHDAGTVAGGDGGSGDGGSGSGDIAGAGDGAADSAGGGSSDAPAAGAPGDGAAGAGTDGDAGSGAGDGGASDKTILGEAAGDDDAGSGADGAAEQEGETRLRFGEGDDAKEILGAPEAYQITLPEDLAKVGITFDKEAFDAVEPILRDLNLSNDAAQALTAAYAEKILPLLQKRAGEANDAIGADMRRQWGEAAGKEFDGREGRASLAEVKALCKQAFIRGGVKEDSPFLIFLEESGMGSHPDMVRTMAYFGRALGEAGIQAGNGQPAPMRPADRIYGHPTPRE